MSLHSLINKGKVHFSVLSLFMFLSISAFSQDGEKLFKSNCATCHKLDTRFVGPALAGVEDRWESRDNLKAWILNSTQYLADHPEDSYAKSLFEEYNKTPMPPNPLSDEEVEAILAYIANPPAPAKEEAAAAAPAEEAPQKDYSLWWLLSLLFLFTIIIGVLRTIRGSLKKLLVQVKTDEELAAIGEVNDLDLPPSKRRKLWIENNTKLFLAGSALVGLVVLYLVWNFIFNIGVFTGYAPEQPIKFSHKIHAGDDGIDCIYCHFGAEKGKTAGIPPVNVCMNCHRGIPSGKRWGKEEISKIYAASGYNPETAMYDKEGKGIEWIKIHNLPDHVYFNHSQHVVVGKIECNTCHGPVEEIDYPMMQYAPLTMEWCINCHRTEEVKMAGNAYYDKLHKQLVEKYKQDGLESFTVSQAGGLECAKCHY